MNFVLVHLGSFPPDYIWDCIAQIQKFSRATIYLYTNYVHDVPSGVIKADAPKWRVEEYQAAAGWMRREGDFWDYAFRRMFIVEAICQHYELTNVVHIENDVLIYSDPAEIKFPHRVCIPPIGPKYAAYAYTWIPYPESIVKANTAALEIASKGYDVLMARYGEGMVNEMLIARELQKKDIIGSLPIFPGDMPVCFDGASAGQYLGGPPGAKPGWTGEHHYIGKEINAGRVKVTFESGGPWIEYGGLKKPLHNLHVHNKRLKEWM